MKVKYQYVASELDETTCISPVVIVASAETIIFGAVMVHRSFFAILTTPEPTVPISCTFHTLFIRVVKPPVVEFPVLAPLSPKSVLDLSTIKDELLIIDVLNALPFANASTPHVLVEFDTL